VALMEEVARQGHDHVAVPGAGELAEIAAIVSEEAPVTVVGFIARHSNRKSIAGRPVVSSWSELDNAQCALLAALEDTRVVLQSFSSEQPSVPVYIPAHLRSLVWKKSK
jgi:hypothetical protein